MRKLYVAFLWHMHQPLYKDELPQRYHLPWVRLHALKGYYDMPSLVEKIPSMKVTFNLTPSLLYQIEDYNNNQQITDDFLALTTKSVSELTPEDKEFILKNFFMINWPRIIKPHARYLELLNKRGPLSSAEDLRKKTKVFTDEDFLDLQVLFNLLWFGFRWRAREPRLGQLISKMRNYTEAEKMEVVDLQRKAMREMIPLYRRLWEQGRVELTTTPFYHPIVPLLYSKDSQGGYEWLEDARWHIEKGLELFVGLLGKKPRGVWPSEGSVSQEVAELLSEYGIDWFATDEDILLRSEGGGQAPGLISNWGKREDLIYSPYLMDLRGKRISIFFRDRRLSDLIGFSYAGMDAEAAAEDFVRKLREIATHQQRDAQGPALVSVILDGENAWEHYRDGGERFLTLVYEKILRDPALEPVTFSEYLDRFPASKKIQKLFAGSWINHNFQIWYGHEEDRRAWDYLEKTRDFLSRQRLPEPKRTLAWREIFAAEGSDWFWWYGDEFVSPTSHVFDFLFRTHLMNVYHIAERRFPAYLKKPIKQFRRSQSKQEPLRFLSPVIDGKVTTFYEWANAGLYSIEEPSEVMAQSERVVAAIFYGFDLKNLCFRLDFSRELDRGAHLDFRGLFHLFVQKEEYEIEFSIFSGQTLEVYKFHGEARRKVAELPEGVRVGSIAEIQVPFDILQARPGEDLSFSFSVMDANRIKLEEWPRWGLLTLKVPDANFENPMWSA